MFRSIPWIACCGLFSLTLIGCGRAETTLSEPVTPDAIKVAQEEEKKSQDAELAEQLKVLQAADAVR